MKEIPGLAYAINRASKVGGNPLHRDVMLAMYVYELLIGKRAARTWPMLKKHGDVETISRLVLKKTASQGYEVLVAAGRVDLSFEAIALKYKSLFPEKIVMAAKGRLGHDPYEELAQ